MIEVAQRIQDVEEYYFSRKLKEVARLKAQGHDVINLGIGSPDIAPPVNVIECMQQSLLETNAHQYQSYRGLPELRQAIASFYKTNYNVSLDADAEVLPLMGSKEGIMHISMAFLNKGDEVLVPNPSYPTYTSVTKLLEAKPIFYDLKEDDNWLPNLEELEQLDLFNVKIMWINYPNMPTGTKANDAFFEAVIAFGLKHNILIINDNPYSFILNKEPKSILQYKNADKICLELNSLSKSFNMAGWRVGMLLGNSILIDSVLKVKSNMDSGMFYGIQKGAISALEQSQEWFNNLNTIYQKRRELIWELVEKLECTYQKEASGLFVWAKLKSNTTSVEFTDKLLNTYSIFVAPGIIFGSNGGGYVRFSLCAPEHVIKDAIKRLKTI